VKNGGYCKFIVAEFCYRRKVAFVCVKLNSVIGKLTLVHLVIYVCIVSQCHLRG